MGLTVERAVLAARIKHHHDPAAVEQARQALALARTEQRIREAIEQAPPLDAATIGRLHSLIPPVDPSHGEAAA